MADAAGGVAVESPASAHLRGWAINEGDGLVSFFTDEPAERLAPKAVPAWMILGSDACDGEGGLVLFYDWPRQSTTGRAVLDAGVPYPCTVAAKFAPDGSVYYEVRATPEESHLEDHHEAVVPVGSKVWEALQIVDGVMHSIREGTGSAVRMEELRTIRRAILSGRGERDTPWDEPGVSITVARPARQTVGARPGREL